MVVVLNCASSTMFVEMLKGKTIEQKKEIKDKDIFLIRIT